MLATVFALLEQATAATTITTTNTYTTIISATGSIDHKTVTLPRNTTSSDSNKVSQKRDSAEHISRHPLNDDVPSTVPPKPKPKPRKLKPITNTDFSVLSDSTENASGDEDKMNTFHVSQENFPASHMHSEESTNVVGNFQSNTHYLANDTV